MAASYWTLSYLKNAACKAMKNGSCQIIPGEKEIIIHLGIQRNQDKLLVSGDANIQAVAKQRQITCICFAC